MPFNESNAVPKAASPKSEVSLDPVPEVAGVVVVVVVVVGVTPTDRTSLAMSAADTLATPDGRGTNPSGRAEVSLPLVRASSCLSRLDTADAFAAVVGAVGTTA